MKLAARHAVERATNFMINGVGHGKIGEERG
jgi:hypothetical protein